MLYSLCETGSALQSRKLTVFGVKSEEKPFKNIIAGVQVEMRKSAWAQTSASNEGNDSVFGLRVVISSFSISEIWGSCSIFFRERPSRCATYDISVVGAILLLCSPSENEESTMGNQSYTPGMSCVPREGWDRIGLCPVDRADASCGHRKTARASERANQRATKRRNDAEGTRDFKCLSWDSQLCTKVRKLLLVYIFLWIYTCVCFQLVLAIA